MERSKSFDLLRTVAIVLVCFGRHLTPCPRGSDSFFQVGIHNLTVVLHRGGWIGVDLFFVLSGFLVSGLLFREYQKFGSLSGKSFLIRRGFKIYPAFWLLIITTVAVKCLWQHHFPIKTTLSELAFVQNYGPFLWSHTWSLAVEEHFYFLLLLFLLFLSRRQRSRNPFGVIPVSFLILATVCLLMRVITAHELPYGHKTHLFPSHLRMDSLFFGVLISYLYHIYPKRFLAFAKQFRWVLVACGIAMLAPAFILQLATSPFIYTFGLTIFYIGSGCLLVASIAMTLPDTRALRFASYIGSHSYSIYLWHVAVAVWMIPVFTRLAGVYWSWPLYAVTYVVCSLSVGVAMALLIEFPTLRVRDRFFPSRGRPLSVSPVGPNPALELTLAPAGALAAQAASAQASASSSALSR